MQLLLRSSIRAAIVCLLAWCFGFPGYGQAVIYANGTATTAEQNLTAAPGQPLVLTVSSTSPGSCAWVKNDATFVGFGTNSYQPTTDGYYHAYDGSQYSNYVYVTFLTGTQTLNYAKVDRVHAVGVKDEPSVNALSTAALDQRIAYQDGFGRLVQQVIVGAAPTSGKDVVQAYAYAAQGTQTKAYLPYAAGTDGQYKTTWQSDQANFYQYNAKIGRPGNGPTYSEVAVDTDPLGRPQAQAAPGEAWQLSAGHTRRQSQRTNRTGGGSDDDQVRLWTYQPGTSLGVIGTVSWTTVAGANALQVTESTDEDGKLQVSYANELGRLVCRRVYLSGSPSSNATAVYLETNYCYDVQGNVLATVPPKATKQLLANQYTAVADVINKLFFLTIYDNLGRAVAKKTPGVAWSFYVYDRWDRLAATQDPHSSTRWTYIKYDALNRPVVTGFISDNSTPAAVANQLAAVTDDQRYEARAETETGYTLTRSYPFNAAEATVTTTNYYDDYDFYPLRRTDLAYAPELGNSAATTQTRGLRTGGRQRVLSNDITLGTWLTSVAYYDEFARPVQSFKDNHTTSSAGTPAVDHTTLRYENGLAVQSYQTHHRYLTTGVLETHTVATTNQYDAKGRLLTLSESIDNSSTVRLAAYEYNELGQLVDKKLGYSAGAGGYLQSLDYRYNIRGWLTNINDRNLSDGAWLGTSDPNTDPDAAADAFGLELSYETVDQPNRCYNGNISAAVWNTNTPSGKMRKYDYTYDQANRLKEANYGALTYLNGAYSFSGEKTDALGEGIYTTKGLLYDENGNITALQRNGLIAAPSNAPKQFGRLDDLAYAYDGNRLQTVADNAQGGAATAAANDFENNRAATTAYGYDERGNIAADPHKNAYSFYNYLNLAYEFDLATDPSKSHFNLISNAYSTGGRKLRSTVQQWNAATNSYDVSTTDYIGGFTYTTGQPLTLATPVGRAVVKQAATSSSPALWTLEYHIRDHQGSLRLVLRQDPPVAMRASMEPVNSRQEEADFDNVAGTRQFDPDHARSGDYAARLNAHQANRRTGPYTTVPVAAGDSIQVEVYGRYDGALRAGLFTGAALVPAVALSGAGNTYSQTADAVRPPPQKRPGLLVGVAVAWEKLTGLFAKREKEVPRASLTYELYDQDSTLVSSNTYYLDDQGKQNWQRLTAGSQAKSDGYARIFLANASPKDTWFDDLNVINFPHASLQENHYDPFGQNLLELETANYSDSRFQYTGQERISDSNLNLYDYSSRYYDFQLGRFNGIDQVAENYPSQGPYNYVLNNSVNHVDPDGKNPVLIAAAVIGAGFNIYAQYKAGHLHDGWDVLKAAGIGAAAGVVGVLTGGFVAPLVGGGILGGAAAGAISGYAAGFTGGSLNDASFGSKTFSGALKAGNSDGVAGAIFGGVLGGAAGALSGEGLYTRPNWAQGKVFPTNIDSTPGAIDGEGEFTVGEAKGKIIVKSADIEADAAQKNWYTGNNQSLSQEGVDKYLDQMRSGTFGGKDASGLGGYRYDGKIIITDGNHRLYAALQYGLETGDFNYVNTLFTNGRFTNANPANYGVGTNPFKIQSNWWKFW